MIDVCFYFVQVTSRFFQVIAAKPIMISFIDVHERHWSSIFYGHLSISLEVGTNYVKLFPALRGRFAMMGVVSSFAHQQSRHPRKIISRN